MDLKHSSHVGATGRSPLRNFKITLEYDGTHFQGWQIQNKQRTIQGCLTEALQKIFKHKVNVIGSGRTDSGVHAAAQVANVQAKTTMTPFQIQKALHTYLPEDMAIVKIEEVPLNFHAQYSAKSKIYRYTIYNSPTRLALNRHFVLHYPYPLNIALMKKQAKHLIGKKDFRAFQASDPNLLHEKSTTRTIKGVLITRKGLIVTIDIEADGFLYKMVRNIVGTLLEIGSGKLPKRDIKDILKKKSRHLAGDTAKAHGLCLIKVNYSLKS